MPEPVHYLSANQVAERIGVKPPSLSRYKLPPADAITGPVNEDGSLPRGTTRGWLPATIDEWNDNRPGRGARSDRMITVFGERYRYTTDVVSTNQVRIDVHTDASDILARFRDLARNEIAALGRSNGASDDLVIDTAVALLQATMGGAGLAFRKVLGEGLDSNSIFVSGSDDPLAAFDMVETVLRKNRVAMYVKSALEQVERGA